MIKALEQDIKVTFIVVTLFIIGLLLAIHFN